MTTLYNDDILIKKIISSMDFDAVVDGIKEGLKEKFAYHFPVEMQVANNALLGLLLDLEKLVEKEGYLPFNQDGIVENLEQSSGHWFEYTTIDTVEKALLQLRIHISAFRDKLNKDIGELS